MSYEHPAFTRAKALPEPWRTHFPKSVEEAHAFRPMTVRVALSSRVLVVARTRVEGAWAADCDAVPGENHDHEEADVLAHGAKMHEHIARALFPRFEGIPYAH